MCAKTVKVLLFFFIFGILSFATKGQYPFEKYLAITYKVYDTWKTYGKSKEENRVHYTLTIPKFYRNGDDLTIQLTNFSMSNNDRSILRIFHNNKQILKTNENVLFDPVAIDTVRTADFNGDGLTDIKLICAYMGCGLAAMNVRVIYLFQQVDMKFIKISFDDMMYTNMQERDFNGDENFEIITTSLNTYKSHNFWTFNLFNLKNGNLISVNTIEDYPIMIQYLNRDNYEVTNKLSRMEMKKYSRKLPEEYVRK